MSTLNGPFPGTIDYDREVVAGQTIREACEHDAKRERMYLTISVGELAQRVVVALAGVRASTPEETPTPSDTERLDWLIAEGAVIRHSTMNTFWLVWHAGNNGVVPCEQMGMYATPREAIDQARSAARSPEPTPEETK